MGLGDGTGIGKRAALVTTPFAKLHSPSLQLGLIKAICARDGVMLDDVHLNIEFAAEIGVGLYNHFSYVASPEAGEWIFGQAAFGDERDEGDYLRHFEQKLAPLLAQTGVDEALLLRLRRSVLPDLVASAAQRLAAYPVVGFSSTFKQNIACLALARHVKRLRPDVKIVFGGANFHGQMGREFFRAFDWIDYAVTGEADHLVSGLFGALLEGQEPPHAAGLLRRGQTADDGKDPIYMGSMDSLPTPDYTSYFQALETFGLTREVLKTDISLAFESSRGCWWGAKHHCTFCGLNSMGMTFRSKSPTRVAAEVQELASTYAITRLDATDNILEKKNFRALMEGFIQLGLPLDLFYELKSNITADEISLMVKGGVRRVQPGIESLNATVLRLMDKGVTGLQNINALRWLSTFGINPFWYMLYGFPGETAEDYDVQAALIPSLVHLPPPRTTPRISLDRFSPNLEREDMRSKFKDVKPRDYYSYLYPSQVNLEKAAYHFTGTAIGGVPIMDFMPFFKAVRSWRNQWWPSLEETYSGRAEWPEGRPTLTYREAGGDRAVVMDGRQQPFDPVTLQLVGAEYRALNAFFLRPKPIKSTLEALSTSRDDLRDLDQAFDRLVELRLVAMEEGSAIALPLCGDYDLRPREGVRSHSHHVQA